MRGWGWGGVGGRFAMLWCIWREGGGRREGKQQIRRLRLRLSGYVQQTHSPLVSTAPPNYPPHPPKKRWSTWESRLAYYDRTYGKLMDEWYEDVINEGNLDMVGV